MARFLKSDKFFLRWNVLFLSISQTLSSRKSGRSAINKSVALSGSSDKERSKRTSTLASNGDKGAHKTKGSEKGDNGATSEYMESEPNVETTQDSNVDGEGLATPQISVSSASKGQKSNTSNKTYAQLIQEAIEALKDRTGSSIPAIKKWLLQEYTHLEDSKHFRHRINQGIKTGVSHGRFEKVRCSYKISAAWKAEERSKRKSAQAKAQAKAKSNGGHKAGEGEKQQTPLNHAELVKQNRKKLFDLAKKLTPTEYQKVQAQMKKKELALSKREEAEKKEKERQERIRKRRFPMEDTKLHEEDKELGVKPPPDVLPRPSLPYFWQTTLPLSDPARQGRRPDHVLRCSKSDALNQGSRGLVSDLLQVYHFFRGDVHINVSKEPITSKRTKRRAEKSGDEPETPPLVPDFSLSNLIFATEEILNGNARRSRLVPPLISHLFVTCLQLLCRAPKDSSGKPPASSDPQEHFQFELNKLLLPALTPASWPDICHLYMDAVERFYSTDSSRDSSVLPPLNTDLAYLFGRIDEPTIPMTPAPSTKHDNANREEKNVFPLPEGYGAYFGDYRGVLFRAHDKLGRSEAWSLTAEEIMVLLRALTDDLLGSYPGLAEKIALREAEMYELLKAKKATDSKFRKVRFAFEGPKKAKKEVSSGAKVEDEENGEGEKETGEAFKQTATKKEFESAARAQQKANDAYEKGIRRLVARTEPIGYDRSHSAVYCFPRDPEVLYVEELRAPSSSPEHLLPDDHQFHRRSWHVIETASLFDAFTESLDVRGKREQDLYEAMLGPAGGQQSLRRYLHNDVKEQAEKSSRRREKEVLLKRLEAARVKCDEEKGRRSGRLADQAEEELARAQNELEEFDQNIVSQSFGKLLSRDDLTGLSILRSFDSGQDRRETRRSREKKESLVFSTANLTCSKLVPSGNIDGTGIVGILVSRLLSVEESCQLVSPWEPQDKRKSWIEKVESAVHLWFNLYTQQCAQPDEQGGILASSPATSGSKKRRGSDTSSFGVPCTQSVASLTNSLKQPLLDLEERVADLTNISASSRDTEIADDNMSIDESGDVENRELRLAWKKELNCLRRTSARQHLKVRELLVNAISMARKAHASDVVADLRAALLLLRPNAANDSKQAGINVLDSHGGFSGPDNEEVDWEDEGAEEKGDPEDAVSVLSAEAALLTGCLGGSDEATRTDWIELVKSSKTLSRLSSLTAGFGHVAEQKLGKIKEERDDLLAAIATWQKDSVKQRGGKKKARSSASFAGPSEVWADVTFTDEICMAKVEEWPWWPAKVCKAKVAGLRKTIDELDRVLVALLGEMGGLRIVTKDMIRPFTGEALTEETAVEVPKKTRIQLEECLAMGRRVQRGTANPGSRACSSMPLAEKR